MKDKYIQITNDDNTYNWLTGGKATGSAENDNISLFIFIFQWINRAIYVCINKCIHTLFGMRVLMRRKVSLENGYKNYEPIKLEINTIIK